MDANTELILIRITGLDRPGLTASFTEILSGYDVTIMDIGQANIHSTLSLGILFKSPKADSGNIMKELLFKASDFGVNIRFYPVPVEEYEDWVSRQGKDRYILTLLGRKLSAKQITAVTHILADQELNIDAIKRLTGRQPLDESKSGVRACIEFSLRGTPRDREEMQRDLMKLSSELEVDFSFQRDNMYRRMRRLICFDMDSTLIQTECIDELAERAGVGEQVRAITESAMRGEIDFKESFAKRVALLKKAPSMTCCWRRWKSTISARRALPKTMWSPFRPPMFWAATGWASLTTAPTPAGCTPSTATTPAPA